MNPSTTSKGPAVNEHDPDHQCRQRATRSVCIAILALAMPLLASACASPSTQASSPSAQALNIPAITSAAPASNQAVAANLSAAAASRSAAAMQASTQAFAAAQASAESSQQAAEATAVPSAAPVLQAAAPSTAPAVVAQPVPQVIAQPVPITHLLVITVYDPSSGAPCAQPNVNVAQVVIQAADNSILDARELPDGRATSTGCEFQVTEPNLTDSVAYTFTLDHNTPLVTSRSWLASHGWQITLVNLVGY
jgi:hypothetical protein